MSSRTSIVLLVLGVACAQQGGGSDANVDLGGDAMVRDATSGGDAGQSADASAAPVCGNGMVEPPETCDYGLGNSDTIPNRCRLDCTPSRCGDAVLDTGEACDSGEANSDVRADACRTTCVAARCGDAVVDTGESCDDGASNSNTTADACRATCVTARCGDGVVDSGEACDDGAANSDTAPGACRTTCVAASCGDGVVDSGEACDDRNQARFDGCDNCVRELTCVVSLEADGSNQASLVSRRIDGATNRLVAANSVSLGAISLASPQVAQTVATCGQDVYAVVRDHGVIYHSRASRTGTIAPATPVSFPAGLSIACAPGRPILYAVRVDASELELHAFPIAADGSLGTSTSIATSQGHGSVVASPIRSAIIPALDGSVWVTSSVLAIDPSGGAALASSAIGSYTLGVTGLQQVSVRPLPDHLIMGGAQVSPDLLAFTSVVLAGAGGRACVALFSADPLQLQPPGPPACAPVTSSPSLPVDVRWVPSTQQLLAVGANGPGCLVDVASNGSLGPLICDLPPGALGVTLTFEATRAVIAGDGRIALLDLSSTPPVSLDQIEFAGVHLDVDRFGCAP